MKIMAHLPMRSLRRRHINARPRLRGAVLCAVLIWPILLWVPQRACAVIQPERWHWVTVNGHRIYYAVRGAGPTLVLLHGGGDSGEHSFERQIDLFAQHHRIIAPDQVGQGHSPDVPGPLSYTLMMQDTAALLRLLKLRNVDVMGFSDGGILALMLAVRHAELVRRLVISGVNIAPEGLTTLRIACRAESGSAERGAQVDAAVAQFTDDRRVEPGDAGDDQQAGTGDIRRSRCDPTRAHARDLPRTATG